MWQNLSFEKRFYSVVGGICVLDICMMLCFLFCLSSSCALRTVCMMLCFLFSLSSSCALGTVCMMLCFLFSLSSSCALRTVCMMLCFLFCLSSSCVLGTVCMMLCFLFCLSSSCDLGTSWPWLYGSWIYNYLCNQCLSPLILWVQISIRARCNTLCDKVCQWLAKGRWFSPGT